MPTSLEPAELVFVGLCDLSGHVRGKAMPLAALAARAGRGVGIVPSAIMMSAFGPIHDTPYGTRGDLALVPDLSTLVDVAFDGGEGERFCLGDVLTPQGAPWACCPRSFLHRAIAALREETGLHVTAAFEQEFTYAGVPDRACSYRLRGVRESGRFGGLLLAALLVGRLFWRVTGGRRLPLADAGALNVVAKGTHWVLYALLVAMVLAGMFLTWTRGDSLFNLFSIPAYDPGNRALPHEVQDVHGTIGWIILALAGVHAAAALVHRYLWHDGVLARMLPRGKGA